MEITPKNITELQPNEVFVFGSNLNGNHAGGAAKLALDKFGAINGQAVGLAGQSYAFPTLSKEMNKITLSELEEYADDLFVFVKKNTDLHFLITEVGCGIAGFSYEEIAPLFKKFVNLKNISLPLNFLEVIGIKGYKAFEEGMKCRNKVYSENTLFEEDCEPEPCMSGMHFCPMPLDVLNYYSHRPSDIYARVVAVGKSKKQGDKVTTNKLKIKAKIKFTDLIKAHFEIVKDSIDKAVSGVDIANTSGDGAHANTSGYGAHANTSGYKAHANTSGYKAHANTSGRFAHANTSGYGAHANTSGDGAHANTSGYKAHANTSG
ncbi:hypothetical protein ACFSTE_09520, partial [Aquimarina hainanensis]